MENLSSPFELFPKKMIRISRVLVYISLLLAFFGWGFGNFPVLLLLAMLAIPFGLAAGIMALIAFTLVVRRKVVGVFLPLAVLVLSVLCVTWEIANLSYDFDKKPVFGFFRTVNLLYQPPGSTNKY